MTHVWHVLCGRSLLLSMAAAIQGQSIVAVAAGNVDALGKAVSSFQLSVK